MSQVSTRAVILPATALLIPGSAGVSDPLAPVRLAVCAALAGLAEAGQPLVLAHGPARTRAPGVLRPTLAAAGIADAMLPDDVLAPWVGRPAGIAAGTAASVALLCLSMALGERAAHIPVLEVPAQPGPPGRALPRATTAAAAEGDPGRDPSPGAGAVVAEHVAAGGTLVVTSGGTPGPGTVAPQDLDLLTPGIAAALTAAGADGWHRETRVFPQDHEHLPPEYRLTVCTAG